MYRTEIKRAPASIHNITGIDRIMVLTHPPLSFSFSSRLIHSSTNNLTMNLLPFPSLYFPSTLQRFNTNVALVHGIYQAHPAQSKRNSTVEYNFVKASIVVVAIYSYRASHSVIRKATVFQTNGKQQAVVVHTSHSPLGWHVRLLSTFISSNIDKLYAWQWLE